MGIQRSYYFLSLPYLFGVPSIFGLSALHWLISQSAFISTTAGYGSDGTSYSDFDAFTAGYFSIGIILTLCTDSFMVVGLIFLGARTYSGDDCSVSNYVFATKDFEFSDWAPPKVFTCSIAVGAACYRREGEDAP